MSDRKAQLNIRFSQTSSETVHTTNRSLKNQSMDRAFLVKFVESAYVCQLIDWLLV